MKSERRHELQTNRLADWVGHQFEKILPYSRAILGGVLGLAIIGVAYTIITHQQHTSAGKAWQAYLEAIMERDVDNQVADLEAVATRETGNAAGLWALQTQADLDLDRASRMLFSNRDEALKILDRAQKNYEKVEQESQRNATLLERARYGLGQVYECQGSLDKAKSKYEQVAKAKSSPAYTKLATRRLEMIGDPAVAEFYAWFEKQKPTPPPPRGQLPGTGMGDLPARPDIQFPDLSGASSTDKPEGPATLDLPGGEKPAESPAAPAPDKPAEGSAEKPAEKPAEGAAEKPAAEKPAAEKPAEKPAE
ncbi:MAG: hypothetical protein U0935_03255 [Pirellulales bacterium]